MSTVLQKCIDITPNGVRQPWSLQDYRLIRVQPWWPKLRATTSWLRLWADWPTLQPQREYAPTIRAAAATATCSPSTSRSSSRSPTG